MKCFTEEKKRTSDCELFKVCMMVWKDKRCVCKHCLCPSRQACFSTRSLLSEACIQITQLNFPSPDYSFRRLNFHFFNGSTDDETNDVSSTLNFYYFVSLAPSTLCHLYTPVFAVLLSNTFHCVYLRKQWTLIWSHRHKKVLWSDMFCFNLPEDYHDVLSLWL